LKAPEDETMKWKRNAKDGVSPVIAVILMVAITVVLLSLDVHAYDDSTANTAGGDSDYIKFTVLSGTVDWSEYKITLEGTTIWNGAATTNWDGPSSTTTGAGETAQFSYTGDQADSDSPIETGNTYNIKIINIEQQKVIWERDVTAVAA